MKKIVLLVLVFLIQNIYALNLTNSPQSYTPSDEFSGYFNSFNCSKVLNKFYYLNCYDFKFKGSKAVAYEIKAENLLKKQLKNRPKFEDDTNLPKKYRTSYGDYKNSGFTRGHIASNASFRFDVRAQKMTFFMSNITPQNEQINAVVWKKAEERERELALKFKSVEVLNLIIYEQKPKRIKNNIAIPSSYIKIIKTPKFKECYQIPNHKVIKEKLKFYRVRCKDF